ncbi:MAG TPA: hypothetical protein VFB69_08205 [Candidatus Dormibacteraeota bacterium]|nr:hypothetical protein [Candidatus Dormibacteraeota bacterium]
MPESEPKPRALEAITPGSPLGWKAVLKSGKQVVVHEIPATPAAATAAVPRLQRLAEHPHPSLSPILAWGTEDGGVWVAVEPNEGTPLASVISRGRFTPHAAAALGLSVLSGVAALHEAGVAMGGFDASTVRLTVNGDVRLAGHPVAAVRGAPSQTDLRADVRSCGMAICAAFGVDPAGAPAPPELSPGLVVAIRSMASGAMGPAVDRAQGSLREMAGPLLAADRQTAAQSEIALRAGGRQMPSVTPFIPGVDDQPASTVPAATAAAPGAPAEPAAGAPTGEDARPSRSVSYDAPPRPLDTYAPLPRPVETYSPPSAYQTSSSLPAQAPEAPAEPAAPPAVPASEPPVPMAAPMPSTPPEPAAPVATNPPPAEVQAPAVPTWEPAPEVSAEPALTWDSVPAGRPMTPDQQPAAFEPAAAAPAAAAAAEPAPAEPAAPPAPKPTGEWSPVATGEWTPGPARHVSSSEWTGEATPAPQPVPAEFTATPPAAAAAAPVAPAVPAMATAAPDFLAGAEPSPTRTSAPSAPARKPSRRPSLDVPSERPRWLIPAAVAVVLLLVLGSAGVYLASHRGNNNTTTAQKSPHPTASPKASPSPTNVLQQVPVYAPSNAAPIKSIQFCTAATPCVAPGLPKATDTNCPQVGARCTVDVGVFYSPSYGGPVSYVLKLFDRCAGTTTDLPGRSSTAGNSQFPKFSVSEISTTVTLPAGAKSAALVAVTTAPSAVQSAPLFLGAASC